MFKSRDGVDVLISIQSDREWRVLAEKVLGDKALAGDPNFGTNVERVKRRAETDGRVAAVFGALDADPLIEKLAAADIAFARVSEPADLARHPHLRRITVGTPTGPTSYPAPAAQRSGAPRTLWRRCRGSVSTPRRSRRSSAAHRERCDLHSEASPISRLMPSFALFRFLFASRRYGIAGL